MCTQTGFPNTIGLSNDNTLSTGNLAYKPMTLPK